jgi:hypothetical protein
MNTILRDAKAAIALFLALGFVYAVDVLRPGEKNAPRLHEVDPRDLGEGAGLARMAVTYHEGATREYDDLGPLLENLGRAYRYVRIRQEDLIDKALYPRYDVLFVTCGTSPPSWFKGQTTGAAPRPGTRFGTWDPDVAERVSRNLRGFVEGGGTIYSSDFQYPLVARTFSELDPDAGAAGPYGDEQALNAEVVDEGLRDQLGPSLKLTFDQRGWYPAAFLSSDMTVYLRGTYKTIRGETKTAPLLVRAPIGKGAVIFTSFHNAEQNSEKEKQLLRFLVLAAVTAKQSSQVRRTMLSGGFRPEKESLLSASRPNQPVTQTYRNQKGRRLQFVLAFDNPQARLRLEVRGPDGNPHTEEDNKTLTIVIENAPIGAWEYTVTPVKVPYENFTFTVTIGEE